MTTNIFKVLTEIDVDEILTNNSDSLSVIMFSTNPCQACSEIKPKFIELAGKYTDCVFLYVDCSIYNPSTNNKYTSDVKKVPMFKLYYKTNLVAVVNGKKYVSIANTIQYVYTEIELGKRRSQLVEPTVKKQVEQPENIVCNDDVCEIPKKTQIKPTKLAVDCEIAKQIKNDVEKNNKQSQDSMLQALLSQQLSNVINTEKKPELKTDKIKEILELQNMRRTLQYNRLQQIQQLKQLQRIKKAQEKRCRDNDD